MIIRKCAWCGCNLGIKKCKPEMDGKISHSICDTCKLELEKEIKET